MVHGEVSESLRHIPTQKLTEDPQSFTDVDSQQQYHDIIHDRFSLTLSDNNEFIG